MYQVNASLYYGLKSCWNCSTSSGLFSNSTLRDLLFVVMLAISILVESPTCAVDPTSLLMGAKEARREITSGIQSWLVERDFGTSIDRILVAVEFDGPLVRFVERNVSINSEGNVLATGKRRTTIINGSRMLTSVDPYFGNVGSWERGSTYLVFDPRALGAEPVLVAGLTLDQILPIADCKSLELVGEERETVDGVECWQIQANMHGGWSRNYWISDGRRFRVLRCTEQRQGRIIDCTYSTDEEVLPTKIVERIVRKQELISEVTYSLRDSKYLAEIDPSVFSIGGLNLLPGATVSDSSLQRVIGVWDGSKLLSDGDRRVASAAFPDGDIASAKSVFAGRRLAIVAVNVLFVVVILSLLVRRHLLKTS